MTAIEPFKVNSSGPAAVVSAIGGLGEAVGAVFGGIGMGSRTRATVKMHQDQMVHEANMQQQAHEQNLAMIDHVTNASKKLDTHAQRLRAKDRDQAMTSAANYLSNPQARVMGGRNFTMQETAEGGRTISHSVAALPRAAKPKAAPKAPVSTKTTVMPTVAATKKPRAKKTSTDTEIINTVTPGEQYND